MQILALDTASPFPSVTLLVREELREESFSQDRRASEELLPAIERCLAAAGTTLARCDRIAVCSGPGSFTGLRIGLATAWALGRAAGVPVETVSSSGLKEETALLGAANAALARGDVKQAQSLLADYDRRPGAAMLSQERAVTGILASCAAGQADAARAAARQFRTRWPRSPLGARVDGSCAGSADPSRLKP